MIIRKDGLLSGSGETKLNKHVEWTQVWRQFARRSQVLPEINVRPDKERKEGRKVTDSIAMVAVSTLLSTFPSGAQMLSGTLIMGWGSPE